MKTIRISSWKCGVCGKEYGNKDNADSCCMSLITCPFCDGTMETKGEGDNTVWICTICDGVVFEYHIGTNLDDIARQL